MAGKNWQAGGRNSIPALALVCLLAIAASCGLAWAAPPGAAGFAPSSYVGELDPNMIWELLLGGIVGVSFLASAGLWVLTVLRRIKRSQLRRSAFVSSALNNLNQGVVMTDARQRIIFCNDCYLEIYGLMRSDIPRDMTGPELLEVRRTRGVLDVSIDAFHIRRHPALTLQLERDDVEARVFQPLGEGPLSGAKVGDPCAGC